MSRVYAVKKGRPTVSPKTNSILIRMSDEDLRILDECCARTGLSRSVVIRLGIREIHTKVSQKRNVIQ